VSHSQNHPPTSPRKGNGHKVSQRGLLSIVTLVFSMSAFAISMVSGVKVVFGVLNDHSDGTLTVVLAQLVAIGLAYFVGWFTALVAIRVYGNLILPILISACTWVCLAVVCYLYIAILKRMYNQPNSLIIFIKYMLVIAGGLGALIGLHLIVEGHDLRPFAIPLIIISLGQLGMIVFRYVFDIENVNPWFIWKDLVFFLAMASVSIAMLAHLGLLEPIRQRLTSHFDRNSTSIRTND